MKVFTIYDRKGEYYGSPFFAPSVGIALRNFAELASDDKSSVFKYPLDFVLFELGSFDDHDGSFSCHPTPRDVGNAESVLRDLGPRVKPDFLNRGAIINGNSEVSR